MSQATPDVEQQLQAWRQMQKMTALPESFMNWENFHMAEHIIYPFGGASVILCALIMLIPFLGRKPSSIGYRYAENMRKTRALVFSTRGTPEIFSVFLVVWLMICAVNALFSLLEEVSVTPSVGTNPTDYLNDFLRPSVFLFTIQLWGIASLMLHVLFTATMYHVGSAAAFAPFAVNFYQTATLTGSEVNHISIWFINTGLFFSLFVFLAFAIPSVKYEYRLAMREVGAHTANVLGKNRRMMKSGDSKKRS